jgi:hypothetical protein
LAREEAGVGRLFTILMFVTLIAVIAGSGYVADMRRGEAESAAQNAVSRMSDVVIGAEFAGFSDPASIRKLIAACENDPEGRLSCVQSGEVKTSKPEQLMVLIRYHLDRKRREKNEGPFAETWATLHGFGSITMRDLEYK